MKKKLIEKLTDYLQKNAQIDAIFLYGSRAKKNARADSDIDLAVLFATYLPGLDGLMRAQRLKQGIEETFNLYDQVDLVDAELVPVPLQKAIIEGDKLDVKNDYHYHRFESSVVSKLEKDYEG